MQPCLMGHIDQWIKVKTVSKFGRPWYKLNNIYRITYLKDHWIALEYDLGDQQIHVYVLLLMHIRDSLLNKFM